MANWLRIALFLALAMLWTGSAEAQTGVNNVMQDYFHGAVDWLAAQQVPNGIEPDPYPTRRHLPIGYQIPQNDPVFRYIGRRSYTYDAAIAAIALAAGGEYAAAENILLAMWRLSEEDGRVWFSYNTNNAWPNDQDFSGAVIRTGTTAWVGYAATFYLRLTAGTPVGPADRRIRERILDLAVRTAGYVMERQIDDPLDPRYGLATGGRGSHTLKVSDSGAVEEDYEFEELGWTSGEHNIDAFFLFYDLHHLTGEERYRVAAEKVAVGLESLWHPGARQLIRGIHDDRTRDEVLPLDTASWGSMFFLARGDHERALTMLDAADDRFAVETEDGVGYIPYGDSSVYEDDTINAAILGRSDATWTEIAPVWIEGSLGVAVARAKAGNAEDAIRIIESMHAYRHRNGGFQYADRLVPHQFTTYRSVAGTAWYAIAVAVLTDDRVLNTFWSLPR
jgi:hypothetical protein